MGRVVTVRLAPLSDGAVLEVSNLRIFIRENEITTSKGTRISVYDALEAIFIVLDAIVRSFLRGFPITIEMDTDTYYTIKNIVESRGGGLEDD